MIIEKKPVVKLANKIDNSAFTETFPSKIVQSNKFPRFLIGYILFAYKLCLGVPLCITIL